uniref:Class E vacuolar protein-sorting machinery protein HSE1 (Trinotate prediction) n=1 Tax=Henneguya salminicola TaxID=69463 RepID=A0A6G3MMF5_HENSL
MPNILLKYAGVSEILEEDRLEFKLNLSAEPLESKFNLSLSSNFDNHISKLCNNSAEISLHSNEINREASPSSCRNPPSNVGKRVVALYSFAAENPDELSFNEGDTIEIVKQAEDEWYVGLLGDGSKGLFPINYVGPFSP